MFQKSGFFLLLFSEVHPHFSLLLKNA